MITEHFVRAQFASWESGDPSPWFQSLPEKGYFHVCGTLNPPAGTYQSKAEVLATNETVISKFSGSPVGKITNVLVSGDILSGCGEEWMEI
jgi:hypothetical protein